MLKKTQPVAPVNLHRLVDIFDWDRNNFDDDDVFSTL